MANGVVCVVVYSLVTVILFCVFCYLISTVDPPPLVNDGKNDSRRFMDFDSNTIFLDDELVVLENAQYGLEKVKKEPNLPLKMYSYNLPTAENIYGTDIRMPSATRNTIATTWPPEPISTITNSTFLIKTTVTAEGFAVKAQRRSISDDLEINKSLGFMSLKVVNGTEHARIGGRMEDITQIRKFKIKTEHN